MDVLRLQIDHVELIVPNRYEAADWYERVLGLTIVPEYESWAADPGGPLMISCDGGSTKLALFEASPAGPRDRPGFRRVAFRTDMRGLREFLRRAAELRLSGADGQPLAPGSIVDHEQALSLYFEDPYGHPLEVTTYDHEAARAMLAELAEES